MASTVVHDTNTLTRHFKASPGRVFAAWADAEARRIWGAPEPGVTLRQDEAHFEVGKGDRTWCIIEGEDRYLVVSQYLDIVPEQRIVMSEVVSEGTTRIGASLATAAFSADGKGTSLMLTIQAVGFDGSAFEEHVALGWGAALDSLSELLVRESA